MAKKEPLSHRNFDPAAANYEGKIYKLIKTRSPQERKENGANNSSYQRPIFCVRHTVLFLGYNY
jgi:hypothetical protein